MRKKLSKIRLLALDFDGTLTDGMVYVDQRGNEMVRCSRKDGLGINMLKTMGILVVVISKETNPVIKKRCEKLRVDCYNGINTGDDKLNILKRYISERGIARKEIVYMGDDINDLPCLKFAGIAVTVADGDKNCRAVAHIITKHKGGNHAVREICDMLISSRIKAD